MEEAPDIQTIKIVKNLCRYYCSKQGGSHPFHLTLILVLPGLLANISTIAGLRRRAVNQLPQLQQLIQFRKKGVPSVCTIARILKRISLDELQAAFAEFLNAVLPSAITVAAVDGKAARQMKDENGDPLFMLNIFAQTLNVHLAGWSVRGDQTNESGCLKRHPGELFTMFPCLKFLTGDAIYAQHSLLEAIQKYHRDDLVPIKENQGKVLSR
jgi:hypothetical protein